VSTADTGLSRSRKGALVSLIVLAGTFAAIVQRYVMGVYWEKRYPLNTFLFIPSKRFTDLRETYEAVIKFETREIVSLVYTPFTHAAMRFVHVVPYYMLLASLLVGFVALLGAILWRGFTDRTEPPLMRLQTVVIMAALSYPVLFVIDRANLEMVVWALVGGFLYFYYVRPKSWAWVLLAIAIAMKMYPAVFLAILFADRRWRALIGAILLVGLLEVSSLLVLSSLTQYSVIELAKMAVRTLRGGHYVKYGLTSAAIPHGHSIWGAFSAWVFFTGKLSFLKRFNGAYTIATLVTGLSIVWFVVKREMVAWKRVAVLTIAMVALPVVSFDYTLIHMYFPMLLFANEKRSDGLDRWYCLLFALVLIPADLFFFGSWIERGPFGASVFVYPAVLVTMLVTIIVRRFQLDHGHGRNP
jgi:hypothetical protein